MTATFNRPVLEAAEARKDILIGEIAILNQNATSLHLTGDVEARDHTLAAVRVLEAEMDVAIHTIGREMAMARLAMAESAFAKPSSV